MKVKDLERVIFTPGLCRESLTSDYYEIDNMVIVGTCGSGKTTAVQSIVKSIIESNDADAYSLMYLDIEGFVTNPFCNKNRVPSCMELMKDFYVREGSYEEKIEQFLEDLLLIHKWADNSDIDVSSRKPLLIIAIDMFELLNDRCRNMVFALMIEEPCIKFILGTQGVSTLKDRLDLIPYRIITRANTSSDSDTLLGCNLGYTKADVYGSCWFYNTQHPCTYKKYNVEYTPESLLNRMMKVHSGYSGKQNQVVGAIRCGLDRRELFNNYLCSMVGTAVNPVDKYVEFIFKWKEDKERKSSLSDYERGLEFFKESEEDRKKYLSMSDCFKAESDD